MIDTYFRKRFPFVLVLLRELLPLCTDDLGDVRIRQARVLCHNRGVLMLPVQYESLDQLSVTTKAALCASLGLPFRGLGIFGSGTHKQKPDDSGGLVPSEDDSVVSSPDMTEA